ncbi:MAG: NUDIX hydrolase, partial [Myxococcales bacterium]|nr:NUDIX hydrolase [Myxococcales bacterium]
VQVDGGEIHDYRWLPPAEALAAQAEGVMDLPAPTYVTSHWLAACSGVEHAFSAFRDRPVPRHLPRTVKVPGGMVSVLSEDVAFDDGDLERPGPRHRVWMVKDGWRYERTDDISPRG